MTDRIGDFLVRIGIMKPYQVEDEQHGSGDREKE